MNAAFRQSLVTWYRADARDLPWRRKPTPYGVWVSEIMLQQTRVEAVRDYFARFIKRFPTVRKLAASDEEDVLEAWSGLGYYRRARMLHATAVQVVAQYRGRFPSSRQEILALPGIGRYSAGAILSIAFNQPEPIVDGNVARVFARLDARNHATKAVWRLAETHVREGAAQGLRPADLNQALMELGATVCTPVKPRCEACPVQSGCRAFRTGAVDAYPKRKARDKPRPIRYLFAAIHDARGRVLMVRRPFDDRTSLLPGGLWELPHQQGARGKAATLAALAKRLGLSLEPQGRPVARTHSIMHYRLALMVQLCTLEGGQTPFSPGRAIEARKSSAAKSGSDPFAWFTPTQARNAAIASATRKLLEATWS